ncbi:MAG TPA: EAL domain-containing protein [Steroidobacteraceae bacterium]|nr:EAL domain-containing protein [Steroidobacteraceae bacterium]
MPTLQPPVAGGASGSFRTGADLHPRLRAQLDSLGLGRAPNPSAALSALLPLISTQYEQIDEERRGVVRSMQMLAAEARSFAQGLTNADAGQLRAILDHIKDVVITVNGDGAICVFNPTGEQLFGYSQAELIGVSILQLLPDLAVQGSLARGLQAFTVETDAHGRNSEPRTTQARRKNGTLFPVEVVASPANFDRREVFVICLRDMSERLATEQALRDSEARYRTLVETAPEVIVVIDTHTGACVDANESALRFFDVPRGQIGTLSLRDLLQAAAAAPAAAPEEDPQAPRVFEWNYDRGAGVTLATEVRLMPLSGTAGLVRASITDITERKRTLAIMAGERDVFARIAADAPLSEVLAATVTLAESINPDFVVCIGRLAPEGKHFIEVIGPRLPAALRAADENGLIDVRNGSSAAAVYLGRAVLVGNVRTDPYWQRRRGLALEAGFSAAWGVPIKAAGGKVLGALTVYRAAPGKPSDRDLMLVMHAARLAAVAIERCVAAEALRTSEARFRGLYESVLEGVYQFSPAGKVLAVNPAFVRLLGFASAEEIYALPGAAALYWDPAARAVFVQELERAGEVHAKETLLRRRDGAQLVVLESARVVRNELQQVVAYEGTIADITERKRIEQAIFEEKERAQVTLQSIGDGVITTDREGRIEYLNPVAEQLSGWRGAEARGATIMEVLRLRDERSHEEIENPLLRCLREDKVVNFGEHSVLINRLGQEIAIQDSAAPIRDRNGRTVGAVVVFRDVTKERRLKRALSYQASHDALTGLINRREFDSRLQAAVQGARNGEGTHALLYVDLDQFKVVNDTCGHPAGDRLLRDVTALLQQQVRSADLIARLGGDEFGILVQNCTTEQATRIADQIRQAVRDYRFSWEHHTATIGASIGVVPITQDSESVASLLSAADIACYAAKDSGRNRVHVYDSSEVSGRHREMYWVSRVTRAVDEGRLELYTQPIVATRHDSPRLPPFHELLVRLRDNDGDLVLPGEFIPAAERYNIIGAIDRWVLEAAVTRLRQYVAAALEVPLLSINLSGTSICERNFLEFVLTLVEEPVIGEHICFEITESAIITGLSQIVYFVQEVRKRGCRIALDDFGTGLSSFHYLKKLPVDFLKIDGQFVGSLTNDPVDRSMVEAISKVAGALGIATIAERVESAEALERLTQLGIDFAQGYQLARPEPLAAFEAALAVARAQA